GAARSGRVVFEVRGIAFDPPDGAFGAEPYDRPVVTGPASALRLPSITHVRRVAGHDQIVARSEEHVAARDDDGAMLDGREIDVALLAQPFPVGHHLAVDAQSRAGPSGKIRRRRYVAGAVPSTATRLCESPVSAWRGRISRQSARVSSSIGGIPRISHASIAHDSGKLPLKKDVSTSTPH